MSWLLNSGSSRLDTWIAPNRFFEEFNVGEPAKSGEKSDLRVLCRLRGSYSVAQEVIRNYLTRILKKQKEGRQRGLPCPLPGDEYELLVLR